MMALTLASAAAAVQLDCTVTQTRARQPYGAPIHATISVTRLDDRRVGNVRAAYRQGDRTWSGEGALVNASQGPGGALTLDLFVAGPARIERRAPGAARYSGWYMLTDGAGRVDESGSCVMLSEGTGR